MANWLEKALGRDEAGQVQAVPFSVTCQCGFQIDGKRQDRAKRMICSKCGVGHFILPTNRYPASERSYFAVDDLGVASVQKPAPESRPPSTEVDLSKDAHPRNDDEELFIDEDHQPTEPELDLVEAAWSTGSGQTSYSDDDLSDDDGDDYELADSDAEIELPPELTRSKKRERLSLQPVEQRKKRKQLPTAPKANEERGKDKLRLVTVCILIFVTVGTMVAVAIRGWRRDRAEIAMREGRDLGIAALQERDFSTARLKLGEAVQAMELLDIDEATRAETRNLWLQAEAGFGLLDSTDVVEIAILAEQMIPEPDDEGNVDDENWQRQFRTQFQDRWLCIQLESVQVVSGDDESGRRVVFPAFPLIHLSGIDSVLDGSSESGLWFAGPLKSCQRDPTNNAAWLIEFDSSRVIACDRSQSLVFPMLSENEQQAIIALNQESDSEGVSGNESEGESDE